MKMILAGSENTVLHSRTKGKIVMETEEGREKSCLGSGTMSCIELERRAEKG